MNTRSFLRMRCGVLLAVSLAITSIASAVGWESVPTILSRIKAPEFPARDFVITKLRRRRRRQQ